jgi:hypothetical protein
MAENEGEAHRMFNSSPLEVAELIREKIEELKTERLKIFEAAEEKSQSTSDYDRAMALGYIKVKNKKITQLDGEPIGEVVQSNLPLIVKGVCWEECLYKERGENGYKAILSNIEAIKAELNGLQSINRHLDSLK